jgi:hypothetical protein
MQRLKELDTPASPIEADAVALLRSAPGYEPPPGQKQRVRAHLLQRRVTRHAVVFRPAVAAGVILFTAVASAAVGRRWIAETIQVFVHAPVAERIAAAPESAMPPRRRGNKRVGLAPAAATGQSALANVTLEKPETEVSEMTTNGVNVGVSPGQKGHGAVVPARIPGSRNTLAAARPVPDPSRGATTGNRARGDRASGERSSGDPAFGVSPVVPDPAGEDTGLVFDAMRALRQEGRPQLASKLLDEYLQRYPEGSLAEEALALSIEAAALRGDARAHTLVGQYLSRYPTGHFRAAVENARARLAL